MGGCEPTGAVKMFHLEKRPAAEAWNRRRSEQREQEIEQMSKRK